MNDFAKWFAGLDESLLCDSHQASLHSHNLTAGHIREFLVSELLERFLPSHVSIETGVVIDKDGQHSKQVDLILFDSRVPSLRSRLGPGLFPVEGVLAAIEVKTAIPSTAKLSEALDNCFSVARCQIAIIGDFMDVFQRRHKELVSDGMTPLNAYIRLAYSIFPPTYIFAINDGLSCSALREGVDTWFHRKKEYIETVPVVPRMILSGSSIGVAHDGISEIHLRDEDKNSISTEHGPQARVLMAFWPNIKHRLSWFASHLLMSINMRTGIQHQYLQATFDIERYMPAKECFASEFDPDRDVYQVIWNGIFPQLEKIASKVTIKPTSDPSL